jgi:16S rRNA G966 N2-methylase RsmD
MRIPTDSQENRIHYLDNLKSSSLANEMRRFDNTGAPSQPKKPSAQAILNGEIHNWYRLRLGYSDHLVADLLDEFSLSPGDRVLDPFCGSGTTLVECMKKGIDSVGIDANPSSCFAASVKINWSLQAGTLLTLLDEIESSVSRYRRQHARLKSDPTYLYLDSSGMLDRGWISPLPLTECLALKHCISELRTTAHYKRALLLALIAEVVDGASNVKFGPELYCGPARKEADVVTGFVDRVETMAFDLRTVRRLKTKGIATVLQGDARKCATVLSTSKRFAAIICSPPYPTEHDYTRNARLELCFLEEVIDRETLRGIKQQMIRSHTKGIYKQDKDSALVKEHKVIQGLVKELDRVTADKTHGFARLYSTVVQEYFGGMKRHLASAKRRLQSKAKCAYIVGDQGSYLGVHIPTAKILASIAEGLDFRVTGIRKWRTRWASVSRREIDEHIVLLEKR